MAYLICLVLLTTILGMLANAVSRLVYRDHRGVLRLYAKSSLVANPARRHAGAVRQAGADRSRLSVLDPPRPARSWSDRL